MEKIKIIQIGITHEHANGKMHSLRSLPDMFEVIGYVDDREFSVTPRFGNDYEKPYEGLRKFTLDEALNYPGLQAVTVEVPNNELVPTAMRCMERNLAIHMDKPAGESLAPYRKLLDGCAARKLPFQMGFMFRGNPAFQFCISAIRSELIGEVFELEADMNHCYGGGVYQEYIGSFPGGIMYNLGCHLIDFVVSAMGRPEHVTPFLKSAPGCPDRILNNCTAVLEYPHAVVTLRSCSKDAANTEGRRMKIVGTNGSISFSPLERFDGKAVELSLHLAEGAGTFPAGKHTLRFPPQSDRYAGQLIELGRIIRGEIGNPELYEHDYLVHEVTLAAAGCNQWR
ncbi:MAG: Gfo/Idh/MocA family oxidoreductase [Lentisphaeria bacterium]|nr:Gfo/Idh/MocA family oxidoreductase [Lentisphaeria bacterium]